MKKNYSYLKEKTVLFAEDDITTRNHMSSIFGLLFAQVYEASNGEEALSLYLEQKPDIIVSDIKMPKLDGITLTKKIRQNDNDTPIILLTSFAEQDLLLNAANLFVDGYLVKPIELTELLESINNTMVRRKLKTSVCQILPNIFYNPTTKEVYKNQELIILGAKEYELLELLYNSTGVVATQDIENSLWPLDITSRSSLKNLVLRLRKKLDNDVIVSVRGIGYRIGPKRKNSLRVSQ